MRISHSVAMQTAAFCRRWNMLPAEGTILCAVSGGQDSMALLHILGQLAEGSRLRIAAAHFNHRLRPTADRDEAFVRGWCQAHDIPCICGSGDVRTAGTGVEDAARALRYRFLEDAAARLGASRIATAHHRDDNAETVLLHLLRGSGPRGLCGIPPVRGRIIRPLLECSRAELHAYVQAWHIPFVEDETNQDTQYTRNRLRIEVLPLLEEISPGCTARMAAAGGLLREEDAHMQAEADALLPAGKPGEEILPVPLLQRQDGAMRRRLVRTMGLRLGVTLTRVQIESILSLGSGGMVSLPESLTAIRFPHRLILRKDGPPPPPLILRPGTQRWGQWQITVRECPEPDRPDAIVLDAAAGPLTVAPWDGTGRLTVENGSRTLKRLFRDRGISPEQRAQHPVLYAAGPAAALGVAVDWNLRPRAGQPALTILFTPADQTGEET